MKPLRTVQWKFFQQEAGVQKKYDKATKHSGWQSWCKMHSTLSRLKYIQSDVTKFAGIKCLNNIE